MEMKPGMRLTSFACDTEVMVIKVGAIGKPTPGSLAGMMTLKIGENTVAEKRVAQIAVGAAMHETFDVGVD